MEFRRFTSIENSYRGRFVDICRQNVNPNVDWYATRKYHGANFSFWVSDAEIKPGKRSGFLTEEEHTKFYGCQEVVDKYSELLSNADHRTLFGDPVEYFVVYGELYGKGIQKEIDYGEKDFIAFSIWIKSEGKELLQIPLAAFQYVCTNLNIPMAEIVSRGTLDELLQLDVEEVKVTGTDQIEEGVVIQPTFPHQLPNGKMAIMKTKSKAFAEKANIRSRKPPAPLSDEATTYYEHLTSFIVEPRLMNVVSKSGKLQVKEFGKLIGLMVKDAIEDCLKEHPEFKDLEVKERNRVHKMVNPLISNMIKENWEDIFLE